MYEALVARVRYHIQKANFMGLKDAESTLLLDEAADAIEELIKPRWISVEERLPGNGQDILAVQSHGGEVRIVPANYDRSVWYDCFFNRAAEHITHWMPLPQPPKEET